MVHPTERVMIITGASSGIGAATARQAAAAGYRLVLAARGEAPLQTMVTDFGGPDRAIGIHCDVSEWTDQESLVAATLHHFGRIDVVFANAGFIKGSLSFSTGAPTPDDWRAMVLANVLGPALTARATLPELIKTRGYLILTGSVVGRMAVPGELYSATKWAITGMGQSLRQELLGTGVHVTVIEPGIVATAFWQGKAVDRPYPVLQPEDVANSVMHVISQPAHVDINEILLRSLGQEV